MLNTAKAMTFLAVTDRERARAFYEGTLGLKFILDDHYALVFDLNGTMLRISPLGSLAPQKFTVLGWQVEDIAAEAAQLVARGIAFERFPGLDHDENGIVTFPNGDKVAWFKDPDGNILSLTQF